MSRETWLADKVEVTVSGVFTTHHVMQTSAGILGELKLPALKMEGVFRRAGGREVVVKRTSWWRGTYELREGGATKGTARPQGIFRRENIVQFDDRPYQLRAAGFWGRVWYLMDAGGRTVVEVRPRGVFRRGAILRILQPLDVGLLVFTYHLVNARWQEQSAAVSAGAGAGS